MEKADPISIPSTWDFEYRYFAGETASQFFHEIMANGDIYGKRCPSCEKVLVPARSFCDACYVETDDWVKVGPDGTLEIFTIVGTKFPGLPDPPFVIGYVTLDGASTSILNRVEGVDLSDLNKAAQKLMLRPRVTAHFSEQREGRITDFHFKLAQSQ